MNVATCIIKKLTIVKLSTLNVWYRMLILFSELKSKL